MATVDSEIFISSQNDGISKRFGHTNYASVGEAHRKVSIFFDQFDDRLGVFSKFGT